MYRPRRPRESPLFLLVEQHIEEFLHVYEERFAKVHGPWRPVVERVLRGFLKCGVVSHGFARAFCETCRPNARAPTSESLDAVDRLTRREVADTAALKRQVAQAALERSAFPF